MIRPHASHPHDAITGSLDPHDPVPTVPASEPAPGHLLDMVDFPIPSLSTDLEGSSNADPPRPTDFVELALATVAAAPPPPQSLLFASCFRDPDAPILDTLGTAKDLRGQSLQSAFAHIPFASADRIRTELDRLSEISQLMERKRRHLIGAADDLAILLTRSRMLLAIRQPVGAQEADTTLISLPDLSTPGPSLPARPHSPGNGGGGQNPDGADGRITGTTVGPHGDNLPEAVILTRLLLMSVRLDDRPAPRRPGAKRPTGSAPLLTGLNYPVADAALFRAILRWNMRRQPRGRGPANARPEGTGEAETITVGSEAWTALLAEAGCQDQRLRVITGTAVVLIDRSAGQARSILRASLAGAAIAEDIADLSAVPPAIPSAIPLADTVALSAAALAFNRDTGQALQVGDLSRRGLNVRVDAAWIDPRGHRRSDRDSLEAIADTAPLAARHLQEQARAALVERFGVRVSGGGPDGRPRWTLTVRWASDAAPG